MRSVRFIITPLVGILICATLFSCGGAKEAAPAPPESPSLRYMPSAPLTGTILQSAGGDFAIRLPAGWIEAVDEENAPDLILWIVRDDYTSSISFTPIRMDPALYRSLQRDGLESVAKVSLSIKKERVGDSLEVTVPIETFRLGDRIHCGYEYATEGGKRIVRAVLFDTGKQFIECDALSMIESAVSSDRRALFEVQQSVLQSLVAR